MVNRQTNKILIVIVRYISYKEKSYYEFPLGLAYISACLKRAGYIVDVLNLNHYDGHQSDLIRNKISNGGYKYILTGGLSAHYRQIKDIAGDVRNSAPGAVVIIGGGVVTATPELMSDFIRPDYMVVGEGELTVVELIDELVNGGKKVNTIRGIGYRNSSGELILTPAREPIMDLDSLPWPDLEGFEFETYLDMQRPNDSLYLYIDDHPRFYPIISSRGCPYNCTFCYHPLGQKYRSRSIDNFIREVEYVTEKYNVNNLAIFDELISADRSRLSEICRRLGELPRKLNWMCQLRVDKVDYEMLREMKAAGCFIISYGFESASNTVLHSMNKHITKEQIEKALELTRKAGIGIQGYFIFGDTNENMKTAYETLEFWKKHKDYHITMGYIRPYPGSELWKREIAAGRIKTFDDQLDMLDKCISSPPNLSQMNQEEWFELQRDACKATITNDHFGELISSEKVSENNYSITIRCPHCRQIVTYNNFHQRILGIFKLACRNCNQAMNMTPLAFGSVKDDYPRNAEVFELIKNGNVPVTVTPCMNEAEFSAMSEAYLDGVNIVNFMDISDAKAGSPYLGKIVLKRNAENIHSRCKDHYFLIPLTRFANRIVAHLLSLGVDSNHICRLDEIILHYSELTVNDFAGIFDETAGNIPDICKDIINTSDFRYRVLSGVEKEHVYLRVFKTLISDTLKVSGPHRKDDWEKGWAENLDNFISHDHDLGELIPKFVKKREVVRFRDNYIMPADPNFETSFVKVLRYYLFLKYFQEVESVYEFGCGTGLNLVAVSELFPQKRLYALDWSQASCKIVDELSGKMNLNLQSRLFDMFNPDERVEINTNSAVFTVGSMEQLGTQFNNFVDFILKKKPRICINIEVIYELHDEKSLFGYVGAFYLKKRNYLRGYLTCLKDLEKDGKIEILETRKTIGGLFHDAYTYIVWRPKPS